MPTRWLACLVAIAAAAGGPASAIAEDWPQLQRDAARTGRTTDTVPAPFRARWVWFGPEDVLRNRQSKPGDPAWTDDLTSGPGRNYRMPESVPFSFAGSMQPIVADGRVFVGDVQGRVYAIALDDGSTLWTAPNPGGTLWPGVATDERVVFASTTGYVTAYDAAGGEQLWQYDAGRSITSSPALLDGVVYVASQSGHVHALKLSDGSEAWTSEYLGGPIQGGLCVADGKVYTGTEAMEALALDASTGEVLARRTLMGQSFRLVWPVAAEGRILFTTVPTVCVGSEYVNDAVLLGRPGQQVGWINDPEQKKPGYPTIDAEQSAIRQWLSGAGSVWETCFALRPGTLEKDYIVATGATEGCGTPPEPPTLDPRGRPLLWWATGHPTLTKRDTFGSNFSMDVSALDLQTGLRVPIDHGRFSGQTTETDNLYGMTVGGEMLYLRQNFRGTWAIDLTNAAGHFISAVYRNRDGGVWPAAITYAEGTLQTEDTQDAVRVPSTPPAPAGRVGPAIADGRLILTENFAVTCVETATGGAR